MSTTARKLRKRIRHAAIIAGLPAPERPTKAPKVVTPLILRSYVQANVLRKQGDALPKDARFRGLIVPGVATPRSAIKVMRFIASGGIKNGTAIRPKAAQ